MTDQAAAPRCALYARTSRADPAGALQFRAMRKFTHGRGWRVYGEFVDARYPGAMDQQPALDELMHEASKHQFDCIVVTKLDRFAFSFTGLWPTAAPEGPGRSVRGRGAIYRYR